MQFLQQHIFHLLATYTADIPLAHFLKTYFKSHTRLGSRDRRSITEALYSYYRLNRFFPDLSPEEVLRFGLAAGLIREPFLNRVFKTEPEADEAGDAAIVPKGKNNLDIAIRGFNPLLPLSSGLTKEEWAETLLEQRALFIRIRQNEAVVKRKLDETGLSFKAITPMADPDAQTCLVLENSVALDQHLTPQDYVIQDYAVQAAVLETARGCRALFKDVSQLRVWDTCAGAGGKTLYWKDLFPRHWIFATDIRASILHNLRQRARRYSAADIQTQVLDLRNVDEVQMPQQPFDLILCDVPCSGSGTWGRTPEQFHFADSGAIQNFPALQYRIVSAAIPKLRPGGMLAYITCSAFEAENEAVAEKIAATMPVRLVHQELIRNRELKSDMIYLALFRTS